MSVPWDELAQRRRGLKRTLLRPVAPTALRLGQGRGPVALRSWLLRRTAFPYYRARDERFERSVGHGVFAGSTRDMLSLYVLTFGVWEPYLTAFIANRLRRGDVFVDVGANSGWYTVLAATAVGREGAVIAVEPSPPLLQLLRAQVARNGIDNVRIVPEAVSDHVGRVAVDIGPEEHTGLTRALRESDAASSVPCRPLPDMLLEEEWHRVKLIKIDVEGAEFAAVRGLTRALDDLPADAEVIVEVGPERAASPNDVADLFATFESVGYAAYRIPNEYGVRDYLEYEPRAALPRIRAAAVESEVNIVFSRIEGPELAVH